MSRGLLAATCVATLCVSAPFLAHGQSVVVVTAGVGRPPDAHVGEGVSGAMEAQGASVVLGSSVRERLGVAALAPVPRSVTSQLGQTAETVLELVASGEEARGIEHGMPVLASARAQLAALGRDAQASADIANLCLYLVRAELAESGDEAAAGRVRACYAMVPDLPVDERLHPPNVRALVSRVRSDIDAGSTILVVRAPPDEPAGCRIRLNGRAIGETPEVRRAVTPGTYVLQTDCGGTARAARTIETPEGSVSRVLVHPRLESALHVGEHGIALVYDSAEQALERAPEDAGMLAAAVDAQEAIAVVAVGSDLRLFRVLVQPTGAPRLLGETTVAVGAPDAALASAVASLAGTSVGSGGGGGGGGGAVAESDSTSIVGPVILGVTGLAALGVLTVGLTTGCSEEDATGACVENRKLATAPAILYGGFGAAAVIAAVLWLALGGSSDTPDEDTVDVAIGPTRADLRLTF